MTSATRTQTTARPRTVLATAVAAVGLLGAAQAWAEPDPVELKVVDRDTGQPLRVWRHHGRQYIAGEPNERYGLRITNNTDGRVLVVLSVDGVNVVTGETAGYDQRGYVLRAHESSDINGWRKSNTEVAAFAFAPLPQSYAARTGRPGDVGVIGMAVFKEKVVPPVPVAVTPTPAPAPQSGAGRSAPVAGTAAYGPIVPRTAPAPPADVPPPPPLPAPPVRQADARPSIVVPSQRVAAVPKTRPDEKLGTAHGARERSVILIVKFDRATPYPQSVRQIEYDTWANLVAGGVIPPWARPEHRPQPFPARPNAEGFVPDPPQER